MTAQTERGKILETALNLTEGDRNNTYGDPHDNLTCFAKLCDAYMGGRLRSVKTPKKTTSVDAAIFMVLAKVSRVAANQNHADNYTDMAAYAAIAGECAKRLEELK